MKASHRFVAGFWLSSIATLGGAAPTPVFEIRESPGVYLQVPLNHRIYYYAADSQLRDLLVIDAKGNGLPARIVRASAPQGENPGGIPLKFFAVPSGAKAKEWLNDGQTQVRIDGRAVSVTVNPLENPEAGESNTPVDFYVADVSELDGSLQKLALDWLAAGSGDYLQVEVSASSDLQDWDFLARETLVQLNREKESLVRREIPLSFSLRSYDYLMIRFPQRDSVELNSMTAYPPAEKESLPPDRWRVEGQQVEAGFPTLNQLAQGPGDAVAAWEYQREDNAPAEAVSIDLGKVPYGDRLRIYSRAGKNRDWHLMHSGIWFNAQLGDEWQRSEPMELRSNTDRFWRLELDRSMGERANPALVFEQPRQLLQFLANNEAPYRIAVAEDIPSGRPSAQVLAQLIGERVVEWQSVAANELNAVLPTERRAKLNWSGWLFWLVLLSAVLVLIGFALRLYRQMNEQ